MDSKDLELDESRSTLHKRIKNLEIQLEDESSERKKIIEQRKDAEAKLMVSSGLLRHLNDNLNCSKLGHK